MCRDKQLTLVFSDLFARNSISKEPKNIERETKIWGKGHFLTDYNTLLSLCAE